MGRRAVGHRIVRRAIGVTVAAVLAAGCGGTDTGTGTLPGSSGVPPTDAASTTDASTTSSVPSSTLDTSTTSTSEPVATSVDVASLDGRLVLLTTYCGVGEWTEPNSGAPTLLCSIRPDGTGAQLLSSPGEDTSGPCITADGVSMLYSVDNGPKVMVDLVDGTRRELGRSEYVPCGTSPDGRWVVFNELEGVWIAHTDGTTFDNGRTRRVLIADPLADFYSRPSWSPDGSTFAYLSRNDGSGGELDCAEVWLGSLDGRATRLTSLADQPDLACPEEIAWSPDGSAIALLSLGSASPTDTITLVDPATGAARAITDYALVPPDESGFGARGHVRAFGWSPGGEHIAAVMGDGTDLRLWVMLADGSATTLVDGAPAGPIGSTRSITWSPR